MNIYPDFPILRDPSTATPESGHVFELAADGSPRTQSIHGGRWWHLNLVHPYLNEAEKTELVEFAFKYQGDAFYWQSPQDKSVFELRFKTLPTETALNNSQYKVEAQVYGQRRVRNSAAGDLLIGMASLHHIVEHDCREAMNGI